MKMTLEGTVLKKPVGKMSRVPSVLIRQLVSDLKWAMRQDNVEINMDWYCHFNVRQRCEVCAAGAMILRRGASHYSHPSVPLSELSGFSPNDFDDVTNWKMRAVNYLRQGDIQLFLGAMRTAGHKIDDSEITRICRTKAANVMMMYSLDGSVHPDELLHWCDKALAFAVCLKSRGH